MKRKKAKEERVDLVRETFEEIPGPRKKKKKQQASLQLPAEWKFGPGDLKWDHTVTASVLLKVLRQFYETSEEHGGGEALPYTKPVSGNYDFTCIRGVKNPDVVIELWPVRYGKQVIPEEESGTIWDVVFIHRKYPRVQLVQPLYEPARGRPRKDWLAVEAIELKKKRKSWAQIARKLYPEADDNISKGRDRIRNLVKSYQRDISKDKSS